MQDFGISNISRVITTKSNKYFYLDHEIAVIIFDKIKGDSTWHYDKDKYFSLLSNIHRLNPKNFKSKIKLETFDFTFKQELENNLINLQKREDTKTLFPEVDNFISDVYKYSDIFQQIIF